MPAASRRALLAALSLAPFARPALAQSGYPNRPVRVLVGSVPGGATDITARIIAEAVSADFPRGFVVENRTGAGGSIAADAGAKSPPDGYTLVILDASMTAINPVIFRSVPYDPATDFTPIALLDDFPFMIVCHPSVPARTFAEFVAWAKRQPDPVQFASPNVGSQHHLGMEILAQRLGFRVQHVGFRGGAQATTALLAGQMPAGSIGLPPLIPQLRAGKLVGLAISGNERSPLLPEIPTLTEAAGPGMAMSVWYGLAGPRDLPADVVQHIDGAMSRALHNPEIVQKLAAQGLTARYLGPAQFAAHIVSERARWGEAARAANIRLD